MYKDVTIKKSSANYIKTIRAIGGQLILNEKELIFEPNYLERFVFSKGVIVNIVDILRVSIIKWWIFFKVLEIESVNGVFKFRVGDVDSWKTTLSMKIKHN